MFGHRGFQPVIQAIIKLAEKAAKEPWNFQPPDKSKYADKAKALVEADLRKAFATPEKQKRHERSRRRAPRSRRSSWHPMPMPASRCCSAPCSRGSKPDVVRGDIIRSGKRIDGRDLKTVRPITCEVGVLPRTHGSALFTRGETQALVTATLGTARGRAAHRRARGQSRRSVPAALQLPALLGRARSASCSGRRPARDRPRQPGRASPAAGHARRRGLPLHDPRRLRHPGIQRLLLHGHGLRRHAGADGRRRAHQGAGRRHRHGPGQGRRPVRGPDRHRRRRRPLRRHGFQGRRHREGHHRASRWTSRSTGITDEIILRTHRGGPRGLPVHPGEDERRRSPAPRKSFPNTPRSS